MKKVITFRLLNFANRALLINREIISQRPLEDSKILGENKVCSVYFSTVMYLSNLSFNTDIYEL